MRNHRVLWRAVAPLLAGVLGAALVGVVTSGAASGSSGRGAGRQGARLEAASSLTCPAGTGTGAPGVSAHQIKIAAVSTLSGILAADFSSMVPGAQAYLDMVNARGGVHGRKIVLADNLDDAGLASQFQSATHTAIDQDQAFAVLVSSYLFTPSYYVATCTPTYGYNVTGNWATAPNLFASAGSTLTFKTEVPSVAYVADHVKAKKIGLLALNVASSSGLCDAVNTLLGKAGYDIAYSDLAVTPIQPVSLSADVQRMQQAGVNFLVSCMSVTNNVSLARDLQQYGFHPAQLWFNGADASVVKKYQSLLQGVYFSVPDVPESAATVYPGTYPGLTKYLATMNKYSPGYADNALALDGWEAAALLVAGIKAAGPHLTQAAVVAATNKLTAFTSGGLEVPVDWATSHITATIVACTAFEQVKGAQVLPALGSGKQVFRCFTVAKVKHPVPVAVPRGTPGPAG